MNREFHSDNPQQKVLTDITEFKYGNNKLYMCATYDLFDKSILSYELSHPANTELVLKILKNSYSGDAVQGALLHSDRGIIHSMSRVGKCIDNGPMKGFFGNIKCEKYYLKKFKQFKSIKL
ncbi:MAG: transposase [Cetobacterium sp.]